MKNKITFGEFFDKYINTNKLNNCKILEFKVDTKAAIKLTKLFELYSDINISNSKEFYREKQLDRVYFYIHKENKWLEAPITRYFNMLNDKGEIEWL